MILGARGRIGVVLLLTAALLAWQALGQAPSDPPGVEAGKDVVLYEAIRARLAGGGAYYPVLAEELVRNGFPTWPVFHWRTPVVLSLDAALPWPSGAIGAYVVLLLGTFAIPRYRSGVDVALALVLVAGLAPFASPAGLLFAETWCAVALTWSAAGYLWDRPVARVGGGILALFFRELAGLWCAIAAIDAVRRRRWDEVAGWAVGGALYALFYAWHVHEVLAAVPAASVERGWLALGGPLHALRCMRWYFPIALVPWLAPLAVGATLLAIGLPPSRFRQIRLPATAALAYLAVFAIFGRPFNDYWGCLLAGLWGAVVPLGVWGALERQRKAFGEAEAATR